MLRALFAGLVVALAGAGPAWSQIEHQGTYSFVRPGFQGTLLLATGSAGQMYFDVRTWSETAADSACGLAGAAVPSPDRLVTRLPGTDTTLSIIFTIEDQATIQTTGDATLLCPPLGTLDGPYFRTGSGVALGPEHLRTAQIRLIELGYLDGRADGVAGAGTRNAITAFQRAVGLPADGTLTLEIMVRLNQMAEALP